jgi:serine protease Do
MRQRILLICLLVLTFLAGGFFVYELTKEGKIYRTENVSEVTIDDKGISASVEKIYDAVVLIEAYKGTEVISSGTGFVYKKDNKNGYIITNEHVIAGATKIQVTFYNYNVVDATLLGEDEFADIAILSVNASHILKVAEIGNSNDAKLGDTVFTVGTPIGNEYMGTVTRGIISGKDRMVTVSVSGSVDDWVMEVLQTDAAINPGNSGGPLVNVNGQVIGINSLKFVKQEIEGMGFSIPIEYAMSHVDKLEKGTKIIRPYLGVELIDAIDTIGLYRAGIAIDEKIKEGAVVASVEANTPAASSGFKKGDVILKIGDTTLKNSAYLRYSLYKYSVGDTIDVTYYRNKETKTIQVKLNKALPKQD